MLLFATLKLRLYGPKRSTDSLKTTRRSKQRLSGADLVAFQSFNFLYFRFSYYMSLFLFAFAFSLRFAFRPILPLFSATLASFHST